MPELLRAGGIYCCKDLKTLQDQVPGPTDTKSQAFRIHYQSALGVTAGMWAPHPEYMGFGENETERQKIYREMMTQSLSAAVIQKIRHCINTGLFLGTATFCDQGNALRSGRLLAITVRRQFSLKIERVPKRHMIKKLTPDGTDHSLDKWMRHGGVWHGLADRTDNRSIRRTRRVPFRPLAGYARLRSAQVASTWRRPGRCWRVVSCCPRRGVRLREFRI